ncbi:hypothetical protein Sango_2993500 [Sesamum angolense]|uniref:Uncharacterized protein n=1 Tax=Sesamum angolense TaxID=2727404 RepID=A0AAE1VXD2_9LAMI|nr:hypothetical protein Sango_2993500 [Sesamum angolense]
MEDREIGPPPKVVKLTERPLQGNIVTCKNLCHHFTSRRNHTDSNFFSPNSLDINVGHEDCCNKEGPKLEWTRVKMQSPLAQAKEKWENLCHSHPFLGLHFESTQRGSGMNLITTIIGFGMSATFIVFVCTRLICGRLRRIEERQMFEIDSRIDLELPEHQINGLEPVVVAAIPTMKFSREAFSSMEDAHRHVQYAVSQYTTLLKENTSLQLLSLRLNHLTVLRSHSSILSNGSSQRCTRAEGNESSQIPADSISIEVDSGVSREASSRPSS